MGAKKSDHRKAFEEIAEGAQEMLGDSLRKLILYGSVARGEEDEESDVDIFAVVGREEEKEELEDLAFEIGLEYGVPVTPIVKTEGEYLALKDSIYGREVRRTGEIVV